MAAWKSRTRYYRVESEVFASRRIFTDSDPLVGIPTLSSASSTTKPDLGKTASKAQVVPDDPLSMLAHKEEVVIDPLSLAVASSFTGPSSSNMASKMAVDDDTFEPWEAKRSGILSKYTTNEKLSITTSFLSGKGQVVPKSGDTLTDKVKTRLEQLDDFEEGSMQEMLDLSQQDYVNRIEELNQELIKAWDTDQRVKVLKIAIQSAKLLGDTSVIQFYPSKFVLITNILDTFGKLVYERILSRSGTTIPGSSVPQPLPADFTPEMVPESAKEICRNWFFKIASIRELLPRLYVEASILKAYKFLSPGECEGALSRLNSMMRGIGDPLVALYARTYLCRVGVLVAPKARTHLMECFNDFVFAYDQTKGLAVQNQIKAQNVEAGKYLSLYVPGVEWILQCIAHKASDSTLVAILEQCTKASNALLLNAIMSSFPPEYISVRALQFVQLINEVSETGLPKYHLLCTLGMNVTLSSPPKDQQLALLQEVWKLVSGLTDSAEYVSCAEAWIEFPCKYFGKKQVNAMLSDIIKHMTPDRAFEGYYPQLLSILSKILSNIKDFSELFAMEKFLPFVDLFQKDKIKVEASKIIMSAFVAHQTEPTSDPLILNSLMYIGKTLHDSLTALTIDDEARQVARLITGFLSKMSFGRDVEQTLNFLVDARASFSNLDVVMEHLVHSANALTMQTLERVKGAHTRKTAAFVRSSIAYSFITIPSISNVYTKLWLYTLSASVAVVNLALMQADGFLQAAVSLLAETSRTEEVNGHTVDHEAEIISFINTLLSTLLYVPDNPDSGVLALFSSLVDVVNAFNWSRPSVHISVLLSCVSFLSAQSQPTYIYGAREVDANDRLYGGAPKFIGFVSEQISKLIEKIHELLATDPGAVFDVFDRLVLIADLTEAHSVELLSSLWSLSKRGNPPFARQERSKGIVQYLVDRNIHGATSLHDTLFSR